MTAPHDVPTAAELVEAVREYLERDVLPDAEGRVRFHGQVAVRVLAMVERELTLGPTQAEAHAERLASLGLTSEADLAAAIRAGDLDDRYDEVKAAVLATVEDKLRVANPGHLEAP
ncbi:MAG: DUF6285 domain-containing protein [Acidimicrobiales bacterium]